MTSFLPQSMLVLAWGVSAAVTACAQQPPANPTAPTEQVTVTASRSSLSTNASASSTRLVSGQELRQAPGFALDDGLRQVPGFELFRRTSSWVANPGTQGVSLRGLGSTSASRTLVLTDEVPLNDPYGGWIHWDEIPQLAVQEVEVLRGGASDLYGSSAIGGVLNVIPVEPTSNRIVADGGYGGLVTPFGDILMTGVRRHWSALAASSFLRTDGYILTAPAARGSVDIPYNVHDQSGRLELRRTFAPGRDVFLLGNVLNEARNNGTPLQNNATRLWRYSAGLDWTLPRTGRVFVRVYGSDQGYRQSYSSIATNRDSERLTDLQRVPSQELGLAVQWAQMFGKVTLVGGADAHDVRADDEEHHVSNGVVAPRTTTTARQRDNGTYGEVLWAPGKWSFAASGRLDSFASFNAEQFVPAATGFTATKLPGSDTLVLDSRLGVVRQLRRHIALTGSGFRAFRGPTLDELYRNSQVGQTIMLGNPLLQPERATGWEAGANFELKRGTMLRASYFWTDVNRPVSFIDLSASATAITEIRENLGQIRSQGVSVDFVTHPLSWVEMSGGYQFADATVTRFAPDPSIIGNWLPEVARNAATVQSRATLPHLGTLNLVLRESGRDYDDTENTLLLHGFFRMDGYYERAFGSHTLFYVSGQNLLDRSIDAGRTPVLTLATPRVIAGGLRISWGS